MAAEDQRQVEEGEAKAPPQDNRAYLRARVKASTLDWVKETASGIATAVAVVLFGLVLVQLGLAQEGQELDFTLFSPYEFWQSFSGLVVHWSQWNEWLLLGLGGVALVVTLLIFLRWRRARPQDQEEVVQPGQRKLLLQRAENTFRSMRTVGAFGMLTGLFLGAYAYQQYLWNVELPVPEDQIGVAFTRQVGSTLARDRLADYLRQMGHEGQIVMRDLPVTLDARDTAQAQEFARRIGADAVVIYREENADAVDPILLSPGPGMAAPARQEGDERKRYVAYIAFADPSLGVQIPVPQRSAQGAVQSVAYRTKEGVEVPRLEATNLGRLMEAAAGILLYDQDRYLPAIAHLKNSLSSGGGDEGSDGLLRFYLGNAYYLINQVSDATKAFDESIRVLERQEQLGVQDRLLLAQVYSYRAEYFAFDDGKLDEGEALLRKAIALREPLDKDETALKDPVTFRRMHDIFGTAYVRLMQIARVREDGDAAALWTNRAKEEAKVLMGRPDDDRAQVRAIWIIFLIGECEQAYKMAYEMLEKKPDDLYAHRLLWRIATLRDNDVTSVETKRHVDALLRINPKSLPDLHTLSLYYSLRIPTDVGYLEDLRATSDLMLEADRSNVEALENYVSQVVVYTGNNEMIRLAPLYGQSVHLPTLTKQQGEWLTDAVHVKKVLAQLETARPYVARWAEEVQPGASRPLVYAARLSKQAEVFIYYYSVYSFIQGKVEKDSDLIAKYEPTWERAVRDATRVLEAKSDPTPIEQARAHSILSQLYSDRGLYETFKSLREGKTPEPDEEIIMKAVEHAQKGVRLVDANPITAIEDRGFDSIVYGDLVLAAIGARNYYHNKGDSAREAEYSKLHDDASARWRELSRQALSQFAKPQLTTGPLTSCAGTQLLSDGSTALSEGETDKALRLLEEYMVNYPHDPQGMAALGWAHYLAGDLGAALGTMERFEEETPDNPYGPARRAIILLAQGKPEEAKEAISAMVERMQNRPPSTRLQVLVNLGEDLDNLSRKEAKARDGVKEILPDVQRYIDSLPPEVHTDLGWRLVLALNNLGSAAIWAEDYEAAERFFEPGLQINGDYVLMRSNLALAKMASGDTPGAQAEYAKAIASADVYLQNESEGDNTEAAATAKSELEAAAEALDSLIEAKPNLEKEGRPLLEELRSAAAKHDR